MKYNMFYALVTAFLLFSCSGGNVDVSQDLPQTVYVYGEAAEGLPMERKVQMCNVYDAANSPVEGCFETYLEFDTGGLSVIGGDGSEWCLEQDGSVVKGGHGSFNGKGIHRLRIDFKAGRWSAVRIDAVRFRQLFGERRTIDGVYSGLGRWKFSDIPLDAGKDEVKYYRFDVDCDSPEELYCLCSTHNSNADDPDSYKSSYQYVRSLGRDEFAGIGGSDGGSVAAFRFIASDRGTANVTLSLTKGQARYIHSIEITPPGPPAAFMGDSITENWKKDSTGHPEFFTSNGYLNFGISGQTTSQMLARFEGEVVANEPQCVVILGGTNDIAGNGGNVTNDQILQNISEMAAMAENANIKVILCSILPTNYYWWKPDVNPVERIADMNVRIKRLCSANGWTYVDFFTPMQDESTRGILDSFSDDRIHPNQAGYTVMENILKPVIDNIICQ